MFKQLLISLTISIVLFSDSFPAIYKPMDKILALDNDPYYKEAEKAIAVDNQFAQILLYEPDIL